MQQPSFEDSEFGDPEWAQVPGQAGRVASAIRWRTAAILAAAIAGALALTHVVG